MTDPVIGKLYYDGYPNSNSLLYRLVAINGDHATLEVAYERDLKPVRKPRTKIVHKGQLVHFCYDLNSSKKDILYALRILQLKLEENNEPHWVEDNLK